MAIKVGILGLGFMGKTHHDTYAKLKGVSVDAICDVNEIKRHGDIGHGMGTVDLSGKRIYSKTSELFSDPEIDVVDICLPTHLHAKLTIAALQAGKHVICEKPMARNSAEAKTMIAAAKKAGKKLFIAQCIRFWPTYVKARDIVLSGKYGKVLTARFCRISPRPTWSWQNWLHGNNKSGLAALDLHIHDADYVQYVFGKPKAVVSQGIGPKKGPSYDHIFTRYLYPGEQFITAEGAWEYHPGFPFSMTFQIVMENATLDMTRDLKLMLYPSKGEPKEVKVPAGDGYLGELKHFTDCLRTGKDSEIVSPESAMNSVKLVEAEMASCKSSKPISVRF